jgi:dTMP kinase
VGLFIALEGGDGSGKATHAKLLSDYLRGQGYDVHESDFPRYGESSAYYVERYLNGDYGGPDDVPAELGSLPYAIDRFAAKDQIIRHLKKDKGVVISNRYVASNMAHQGAKINDADLRKVFYERTMLTEYDILGIPKPDLSIVLIMPSEHAQANVDKKETRSYTSLKRDIHEADAGHLDRAKANFEELCKIYPTEFAAISCTQASGAMRPIEEIQTQLRQLVSKRLGPAA